MPFPAIQSLAWPDIVAWGSLVFKAVKSTVLSVSKFKRKQLHLFVLKAIAYNPLTKPQPGKRHTISEIVEKVKNASVDHEVGDWTIGQRMGWNYTTKRKHKTAADSKSYLKSLGLPDRNDPNYEEKIEEIVQQMVEVGKLNYYPPDSYSLKS